MMYNKDDVIYILENNTTIRKGKIARKQGDNYIIQLNSANVQNDFISVKPDPFDNWIGR